ncbi:MAG: hypothetical protein ACXWUG_28410 [Polyangiales bacterium]
MIRHIFVLAAHLVANSPMSEKPPPPPPEAFIACEGKASGDACTVHVHDKDITGRCSSSPDDSRLFCRPDGPPPPPPQ